MHGGGYKTLTLRLVRRPLEWMVKDAAKSAGPGHFIEASSLVKSSSAQLIVYAAVFTILTQPLCLDPIQYLLLLYVLHCSSA